MTPTIENHVIVVWPWAKKQKKIVRYISRNFFVLDKFVGHTSLKEFYGLGPDKPIAAQAFVVRTMHARQPRPTSTGKRLVNPFTFDAKQKLRGWGGKHEHLNSVHASDDQEEAVRNLSHLLPKRPPTLRHGGVTLREGDDIDLLVADVATYVSNIKAVRIDGYNVIGVDEEDVKYKHLIRVGNDLQVLDIREPGDGYMDPRWQQAILDSGEYDEYAQLYHALIHKGEDGDMGKLVAYMQQHEYEVTRPSDPYFVQFNSLIGRVVDGYGAASADPQPGLTEKWEDACGYVPYPGTLNIQYEGKFQLPKPHYSSSINVLHPGRGVVEAKPLYFWPVSIASGNARTGGHLTVGGNRPDEVEILAKEKLRDVLSLKNGNRVRVMVNEAAN